MPYDIYVLDESDITISGGGQLDGVTQGSGVHLDGLTITLNTNDWAAVSVNDDDPNFQDSDGSQTLNGAHTIDGVTYAGGTVVEAEYALELSDGVNTWTVVGFNVNNSSPVYGTVEGLAFIGGSGGFPPVGVALTVTATFEGPNFAAPDYATPICFVSGTLIETPNGSVAVENLSVGDLVVTKNGPKPIRWISSNDFPAQGAFAPVVFEPNAIGNNRRLKVSAQHRIEVTDWRAELLFASEAVLVPAKSFVDGKLVHIEEGGTVTYHHFMFDAHEIVFAEGVAAESFHPGDRGLESLAFESRKELFSIFPELAEDVQAYGAAALPDVRGREAAVLLAH